MRSLERRDDRRRESLSRKPAPVKKTVPQPTNNPRRVKNKLYVCGLLPNVMREEVIKTFGAYGKLQEVWVAKKPAGFAFVEFSNSRDAERVVHELDGKKLFGSTIRIEFAKSNKYPDESKEHQKPSQSNAPLLPLKQPLLPMKIPLLGPPIPLTVAVPHHFSNQPYSDSKVYPRSNQSILSSDALLKRRRSISMERPSNPRYNRSPRRRPPSPPPPRRPLHMSPRGHDPRDAYPPFPRRSPGYRHWEGHRQGGPTREVQRRPFPPQSSLSRDRQPAPHPRGHYRSPIKYPRYSISPDRTKAIKWSISPVRDHCIDDDASSASEGRNNSSRHVKSMVQSVSKNADARKTPPQQHSSSTSPVSGGEKGGKSPHFGVELKKRPIEPRSDRRSLSISPRRKHSRRDSEEEEEEEESSPVSISRTRLLGRTPPTPPCRSPQKEAGQSVEKAGSSRSRSHSPEKRDDDEDEEEEEEEKAVQRPVERPLSPIRPPLRRSPLPPAQRQQRRERRAPSRAHESTGSSSSGGSSSESQSDAERRKVMLKKKKKKTTSSSSSRSSSMESVQQRQPRRRPVRRPSSDSRRTPLAYQQRSVSGRKAPSPRMRSPPPPNKLLPLRVYRSKEFSPGRQSPPHLPQYPRSHDWHSPPRPIHHRPFPPMARRVYERSPEARRYYDDYPPRPPSYYPERIDYKESFYYKRDDYQDYPPEGSYYRRPPPYIQPPPHYAAPYRRRETYPGDGQFYAPPRNKIPFVYRGKIRNPPIIYNRSETKKE